MKDICRILAVDDHEMILRGYQLILESADYDDFEVRMELALTYEMAEQKIKQARNNPYHMILLDIQLDPDYTETTVTGEELAKLARKELPESKIVFMSSYSDSLRVHSLLESINMEGYMVKSEIDEKSLITMVDMIRNGSTYYTAMVMGAIRQRGKTNVHLDDFDKNILKELSAGTMTKDIGPRIGLSRSSVENRKRNLKIMFGVEGENDILLLKKARELGFL